MAVEVLVGAGASLTALDREKRPPLYRPAIRGHDNVVHFLVERGCTIPEGLAEEARKARQEPVAEYLEQKRNVP